MIRAEKFWIIDESPCYPHPRTLMTADYEPHTGMYWMETIVLNRLRIPEEGAPVMQVSVSNADTFDLWHQRFGHAGKKAIENLPSKVKGVPKGLTAPDKETPCEGCLFGKHRRDPFPPSESRATAPLELVHMDLVEYPSNSIDGFRCSLTTLDDYSSLGLMWYLKHKSDAFTSFKLYVAWAKN